MRLEEVMTAKTHKHAHFFALASALSRFSRQNLDGSSQIVVTDAMGNPAKMLEGADVRVQEAFLSLRRKGHRERPARVAEPHEEDLDLLTVASDHRDGLAPIDLRIGPWIVFKGEKDLELLRGLFVVSDILAHARFAALVALCLENLKNLVCGIALFGGHLLILVQQLLNAGLVRAEDRSGSRTSEVVWLGRSLIHHLGDHLAAVALILCNLIDTFVLDVIGAPDAFIHMLVEHRCSLRPLWVRVPSSCFSPPKCSRVPWLVFPRRSESDGLFHDTTTTYNNLQGPSSRFYVSFLEREGVYFCSLVGGAGQRVGKYPRHKLESTSPVLASSLLACARSRHRFHCRHMP